MVKFSLIEDNLNIVLDSRLRRDIPEKDNDKFQGSLQATHENQQWAKRSRRY